jgi:hypothetical protein
MSKEFIGVRYNDDNGISKTSKDFVILQKKLKGVLFIYNDNIYDWLSGTYNAGGGNGALRSHRSDGYVKNKNLNNFVLGIPTISAGQHLNDIINYQYNDQTYGFTIDMAITNIENAIIINRIEYAYWSTDEKNNLAYSIFNPDDAFKQYVNSRIDQALTKISTKNRILQENLLAIDIIKDSKTINVLEKKVDNVLTVVRNYIAKYNKKPIDNITKKIQNIVIPIQESKQEIPIQSSLPIATKSNTLPIPTNTSSSIITSYRSQQYPIQVNNHSLMNYNNLVNTYSYAVDKGYTRKQIEQDHMNVKDLEQVEELIPFNQRPQLLGRDKRILANTLGNKIPIDASLVSRIVNRKSTDINTNLNDDFLTRSGIIAYYKGNLLKDFTNNKYYEWLLDLVKVDTSDDRQLKIEFLKTRILKKEVVDKILDKIVYNNNLNWWNLRKNEDMIKEVKKIIVRRIAKILKSNNY